MNLKFICRDYVFIEFSFIANSFILFASRIFTLIFSEISFSLKGNISL
ncbi:hypothetical protein BAPKO_0480 [Borreliella afzelii PKo]|nr:hypothetical protein BAPKO_0480 [Borreliella afzelii PKo]